MPETSDTSTIDEKKAKTKSLNKGDYISKFGGFISTAIVLFIVIIIYYTGSGLILYVCKLAQSNILPTDINCAPYTDTEPNIQPIETNIFQTGGEKPLSMKISFPYDAYNSKNYILDMFREYKNDPNSNFLANYLISLIESVIQFNYAAGSKILDALNVLFPETVLVIFGPIIMAFILQFIYMANHVYLMYLWFAQMGWFFKTNKNKSRSGPPEWEDVTFFSPFKYYCAIVLVILFSMVFFCGFLFFTFPFISILAGLSISWCIFSSITYKAKMGGKVITAITIIKDTFKYYKSLIMSIISFFVVLTAWIRLGKLSGIISIVALSLIYFGIISIDLFNPSNKDNLSQIVSDIQAKKSCNFTEASKEKHGLLYGLLFGQKGGNIIKEIKEFGKKNIS
jgi:hypothetical protein